MLWWCLFILDIHFRISFYQQSVLAKWCRAALLRAAGCRRWGLWCICGGLRFSLHVTVRLWWLNWKSATPVWYKASFWPGTRLSCMSSVVHTWVFGTFCLTNSAVLLVMNWFICHMLWVNNYVMTLILKRVSAFLQVIDSLHYMSFCLTSLFLYLWLAEQCNWYSLLLWAGWWGDWIPLGGWNFSHPSWLALGPTQPPVEYSQCVALTTHLHLVPKLKKE